MSDQVVLLCKAAKSGPEIFSETVESLPIKPNRLWRAEKDRGWVFYERRDLWMPRKDGVFSLVPVFVDGDIEDTDLIDLIWNVLDSSDD